jgi:WXG100 family type VII secretion target
VVDERMDYEAMEKMAKEFKAAQSQLAETLSAMKNASKMMEGGALLGAGGDAFQAVINQKVTKKLTKMIDKFKDSESDIKKAIQENKKAVATGKKGF